MRVFISWSGERSRQVADRLHGWMPSVIQAVDAYISTNSIHKGERWAANLAAELERTHFGIVCLLPENTRAPWIQYEAGALSKHLKEGKLAPILFGVKQSDLGDDPLSHFQCTQFLKGDMLKLMNAVNQAEGTETLRPRILESAFEKNWNDLNDAVQAIMAQPPPELPGDQSHLEKAFEAVAALVREQSNRVLGLEQKVSNLTSTDVVGEDRFILKNFLDALLEVAGAIHKSVGVLEQEVVVQKQSGAGVSPMLTTRLENIKAGANLMIVGVRKAREGGGTNKAVRSALPELRRSIFLIEA